MRSPLRLLIVCAVLLTFSAPGDCQPDDKAPGRLSRDWKRLTTPNLVVVGNARDGELRRAAVQMERFRGALGGLSSRLRLDSPVPTTLVVFRDDAAFTPFKPRARGKPVDHVAGYFVALPHVNYLAMAPSGAREVTLRVMFHEYTHYVINRNFNRLPLWLNEGLAEFYSTFAGSEKDDRTIIGRPIDWHIATLIRRTPVPLAKFVLPSTPAEMYRDSWGTGLFYAQSWALTHFLLVGQQGARKPQLGRFLQAVSSGQPMDTAFTDAFGPDLTVLDRELRAYVQQFQLPAIMLQPEAVNVSADPAPMTEIEVQYLQGDLLARMGAMDLAETYLSKALEIDPTFVPARLSRAELRMMQDRPADALDIASAPDLETAADYYTQFVRAEALRASEKHDAAIAAYTRAIEHRTDAPFAYYGLSMSQLATGHKGAAANFSRCMALRPDPEWYRRRQLETMRLGLDGFVVSDAANYLRLVGWRGDEGTYVLLPAVLTHLRRGEKDQAMESLDDIERHIDAKSWQASLVAFLRGTITAETLVARAKTDDGLLTEAHAYAGIMANIAGAPDVGLKHLEWVKARGRKDYIEYGFALGELRRTRPTKP